MTKQECIACAAAARRAAEQASARAELYASTFGANSLLTQSAIREANAASSAARQWENVATWPPQTRAKALRDQSMPATMFQYR